ncbi:MAG TPA: thioredoxin domain-containing protein [Gemmatimonadales bacterium]|nr:thioredoxin domain-containing protein [Gemmatimonadales bacterium]
MSGERTAVGRTLRWALAAVATMIAAQLPVGPSARLGAQTAARPDPLASRSKGTATAPVTVYEMSDFQCPYCRRHALDVFPTLEREYVRTGKVRWVFINFPLVSIHANAVPAAELAMCAARLGKFWPIHDLLFKYQEMWAPLREPGPFMLSLADSAKVPRPPLVRCLQTQATRAEIQAEAQGSERSGAGSTPTFYIEGGLLVGAHPAPVWRRVLDSIHAAKVAGGGEQ